MKFKTYYNHIKLQAQRGKHVYIKDFDDLFKQNEQTIHKQAFLIGIT